MAEPKPNAPTDTEPKSPPNTPSEAMPEAKIGTEIDDFFGSNEQAKEASRHEQHMTVKYAIQYYYPAMIWAILMAAPIIMEGYETALVPTFFSYVAFEQLYGSEVGLMDGKPHIPAMWQSGITISAAVGQLIGLFITPFVINRFGYKRSTLSGLTAAALFLLITFSSSWVSHNFKLPVYLLGELLLGIPWGLFQGLTLPYVSDIVPLKLKGPATTMINIFWLLGQLISSGVLRAAQEIESPNWAARAPMLIQYAWILPLTCIVCLSPESPLYLIRTQQDDKAARTLRCLSRDPHYDLQGSLDALKTIDAHERDDSTSMGFSSCFKGTNLRRTEIAVVVYLTQQLVGTPLIFYGVKLLQKGGLDQGMSLAVSMLTYGLCIISTLASMVAMRRFGRRTMWIGGLGIETACLIIIGSTGCVLKRSYLRWVISVFLGIFAIIYNLTIGPVCYTIVAETPSTRLKAATNSVARGMYICLTIVNLFLVPNLLEDKPSGWGLGVRAALVWAGSASLCLAWAWFRLPEMKDKTPAEIDIMFAERKTK